MQDSNDLWKDNACQNCQTCLFTWLYEWWVDILSIIFCLSDQSAWEGQWQCAGAIIILFVQVSIRNENSLKLNFLPQKVHKSFMCNVTDVKQTMAYLNFAFVTNLQFSVCPTVTKTTLDTHLKHWKLFQQGLNDQVRPY